MGDVTDLDSRRLHHTAEVMCRACGHAYIATFPVGTPRLSLECPKCHACKSFAVPVDVWGED